jgi:hypothetical protein
MVLYWGQKFRPALSLWENNDTGGTGNIFEQVLMFPVVN